MIKGSFFSFMLGTGLLYASVSVTMERKHKRQQVIKERVENLLETNESLAHLQQDSPLLDADIFDFPDLMQKLIDKKAQLEVVDKEGGTPLSYATARNKLPAVKVLLKAGANPNHKIEWFSNYDWSLHIALKYASLEIVHELLAYGANFNTTSKFLGNYSNAFDPVFITGKKDGLAKIRLLLAHGADPARTDSEGLNALARLKQHYERALICPLDYKKAWRYKAIGKMLIKHRMLKRMLAQKVPHDVARYITQFVFAGEEPTKCPLCIEAISEVTTGCNHSFCDPCITTWLDTHKNCPACNVVLIKDAPPSVPVFGRPGIDF